MLTYNHTLPSQPPMALQMPTDSPFTKFGSTHGDMLAAQLGRAQADYDVNAARSANDYAQRFMDAENQLVLQGLNNMGQAQQNDNSLFNQRLGNMTGILASLYQ
jgi:hypothetical protein